MGMTEITTYQIVCDGADCFAQSDAAESEGLARKYARVDGFKETHCGQWFCAKCARTTTTQEKPHG